MTISQVSKGSRKYTEGWKPLDAELSSGCVIPDTLRRSLLSNSLEDLFLLAYTEGAQEKVYE